MLEDTKIDKDSFFSYLTRLHRIPSNKRQNSKVEVYCELCGRNKEICNKDHCLKEDYAE